MQATSVHETECMLVTMGCASAYEACASVYVHVFIQILHRILYFLLCLLYLLGKEIRTETRPSARSDAIPTISRGCGRIGVKSKEEAQQTQRKRNRQHEH